MKNCLLILFFLAFNFVNAQCDTIAMTNIRNATYKIDWQNLKARNNLNFDLDSAEVIVTDYKHKISTKSTFEKSKVQIDIDFYLKNGKLIFAGAKQYQKNNEEHYVENCYYFENDSVFISEITYPIEAICGWVIDEDELKKNPYKYYELNESFDESFLKKYTENLFLKIKNHR